MHSNWCVNDKTMNVDYNALNKFYTKFKIKRRFETESQQNENVAVNYCRFESKHLMRLWTDTLIGDGVEINAKRAINI